MLLNTTVFSLCAFWDQILGCCVLKPDQRRKLGGKSIILLESLNLTKLEQERTLVWSIRFQFKHLLNIYYVLGVFILISLSNIYSLKSHFEQGLSLRQSRVLPTLLPYRDC